MKKILVVAMLSVLVMSLFVMGVIADEERGPAPSSHDGNPDGSGMDDRFQDGDSNGDGEPSLCSGDGIPDGSC